MSGTSVRVLHVDDEPDFADLAATFLEREDGRFDVETVTSAEEGLERLADAEFDCIVSDYEMPRTNGIEFLERVREVNPELPFILFTGKGSEDVASDAISAGVTDYLQKSSDTSQYELLANRITNAVKSSRTERRAELQQRQYRDLFEQAPVMYVVTRDEDGQLRIEDCNDRFLDRLGYDRDEVIDRPISAFYTDEAKRRMHEEGGYEQALQGAFGIQERTLVTKDGERVHVLNRANPRLDSQGTPVGGQAMYLDITERKERERRLELAIQQTRSGVWEYDVESGLVTRHEGASDLWAAETHTTVPMEEAITERVHPEDRGAVWNALEATVEDGEPYHVEFRHQTPDGYRWAEARGELVRETDAGPGRLIGLTTDIHAYKEREQELRETTARLTALFERSPDMINVHDPAGNIIDPNPRLCEKTGYDEAELTEMKVWDLDQTIDPDEIRTLWDEMETGDRHELEGRYERRDGSTFPVEVHLRRLELDGEDRFVVISHDITDRKDRQRELELYETMVETVPDGVYALDEDLQLLAANRGLADMVGYSQEELVDSHLSLVNPEGGVETARRNREQLLGADGEVDDTIHVLEHVLVTKDGEEIPCEARFRALPPAEDGSFRGTAGVVRDISDRLERERELEEYREYTDRVLDAIDDLFFVHDEHGDLQRWNKSLAEATGYDDEEIGAMNGADFVPEEYRERTAAAIQEVFETGHARLEAPLVTKGGDTIPYEFVADRVEHPDGDPRLVGIGRDISERKERERELQRYEELIENLPIGVYRNTPGEEGEWEFVNEAMLEFLGLASEADLGDRSVAEFYADPDARADFSQTLMEEGIVEDHEIEIETADGETKWATVTALKVERDGGIYFDSAIKDITERKKREQELQRERDRLDKFASVIAHDLRNPLNVALGNVELAREDCDSAHLDTAANALDRMDALIEDILTVAREGTEIESTEPTDLAAVIDACWCNVETADATLVVDTEATIHADPSLLKRLLGNLVRNAVEHGGADVTITVGDLDDERGFYVADDGDGISDDEREQVFESGYSTSEENTGFGLSIVQEIAEAHGWKVDVTESDEGGARFEITGVEMDPVSPPR